MALFMLLIENPEIQVSLENNPAQINISQGHSKLPFAGSSFIKCILPV